MSRSPLISLAALLALTATALAQGSDSCAGAQVISGTGTFAFNNTAATTDGMPHQLCSAFGENNIANDVWFAWTAPSSGLVTIATCALTTIDSRIAVLDGSCAGNVLACNDDACASLQSSLDVSVTGGHLYLLRVGNYPGASPGTGSVSINLPGLLSVADTRVNPANGHTYHLLTGGSWTAAEATAVSLGSHLVTVDDQAEHDWIKQQWNNYQGTYRDLWIGFNDAAVEGTFVWADGTPVGYTNWDPSAPDDPNGTEDYAAMRKNDPVSAFWIDLPNAPTGFHANPHGVVEIDAPIMPFCSGDGSLATNCPCGNLGATGKGCQNSVGTGGAFLSASGTTVPDTLVLTSTGELPSALSIFLQGTAQNSSGILFGDGVRCITGVLRRLYTRNASGGVVSAPQGADPSITQRSANAGDPIPPGGTRYYQVYYRDPSGTFCPNPPGNTWNVSSGLTITW